MHKYFSLNSTKISILLLSITILTAIYIMFNGLGKVEGLDTGAGDYYYTDIPGWENIFFGENYIRLGTNHPIIFFTLFIVWGLICYKFLKWIDQKK